MNEMLPLVKFFLAVMAVLISVPVMVMVVKLTNFLGSIRTLAEATSADLSKFTDRIDHILEDHEGRIREGETKLVVLWDGRERRDGEDRRKANA